MAGTRLACAYRPTHVLCHVRYSRSLCSYQAEGPRPGSGFPNPLFPDHVTITGNLRVGSCTLGHARVTMGSEVVLEGWVTWGSRGDQKADTWGGSRGVRVCTGRR
eukprot:2665986-Rhodomonas_salina.3